MRRSVREGAAVALSDNEPFLTRTPQQGQRLELRDLERAIAKLPEEQRSAILLVGLEGLRYEEVAAIFDVPVGTIRSRLSRGREALRRLMELDPEEETDTANPAGCAASRRYPGAAGRSEIAVDRLRLAPPVGRDVHRNQLMQPIPHPHEL